MIKRFIAAAVLVTLVSGTAACGSTAEEGDSEQEQTNVWDTYCDDYENLVYVTYSGDIFVIEDATTCD